jgi:Fic family protein
MKEIQGLDIIQFLIQNPGSSSKDIFNGLDSGKSYATLKRKLSRLISINKITAQGQGKSTTYFISQSFDILDSIDIDKYFEQEIDDRKIKTEFNFDIFQTLTSISVFNKNELERLEKLHEIYSNNISKLSDVEFKKELERLAIDLSWKSSQIEGNTYSLLETERLIKDKETASGKTKEEAIMLLNHKSAIDFIVENPDYLSPLYISKIEDIHSLLIGDLGIEKNLRRSRVGITGTNYKPLDNEFQIKEALQNTCDLVNLKKNTFEKAFLTLLLLSYIQAFSDGNKRTARIVSNAILMNGGVCPLSYRTVDSIHYKKAMLVFYEQNNLSGMKDIFINQYEFAVSTYF